jgi:hypothetical protein
MRHGGRAGAIDMDFGTDAAIVHPERRKDVAMLSS